MELYSMCLFKTSMIAQYFQEPSMLWPMTRVQLRRPNAVPLYGYSMFIHSFTSGHWHCFHLWASMNMSTQTALWDPAFLSAGFVPRNEIPRVHGNSEFSTPKWVHCISLQHHFVWAGQGFLPPFQTNYLRGGARRWNSWDWDPGPHSPVSWPFLISLVAGDAHSPVGVPSSPSPSQNHSCFCQVPVSVHPCSPAPFLVLRFSCLLRPQFLLWNGPLLLSSSCCGPSSCPLPGWLAAVFLRVRGATHSQASICFPIWSQLLS